MIVRCIYCGRKEDYWSGKLRKLEGHWFACPDHELMECMARRRERKAAS